MSQNLSSAAVVIGALRVKSLIFQQHKVNTCSFIIGVNTKSVLKLSAWLKGASHLIPPVVI